ncbi:MAG: CRTAC1 family protein [Phycisphaerales bacterium]|nr:CRTAC1 family protein [Phycisphaerales bacterium]
MTESVGLAFVHDVGSGPQGSDYYMPESMAAGGALFDMDQDGDLDIYLINGARTHSDDEGLPPLRNRLYRQDAGPRFVDATDSSGLGDAGYGMGVAIGDIDNDGDEDVYVTNVGNDALYRNNGDATFTNITAAAGIQEDQWGASAAFFDYDRDDYLDLFVTHYVALDPSVKAFDNAGRREYPGPHLFHGTTSALYRNNGDGTFADVSQGAGIASAALRGLGVVCGDFDEDGWPDVFVANDGQPNQMWINRHDGTFEDRGMAMGVAVNLFGQAEANMGIAVGDVDGDLDMDLFITHLTGEQNTLYVNLGGGLFEDRSVVAGLAAPSIPFTGFGTAFIDYDDDGDLDLLAVNGRVRRGLVHPGAAVPAHWQGYAEPNQLFENDGGGRFTDASSGAGPICGRAEVGRGLAVGDVDNDGDQDVLITNGGGPARLFLNEYERGNWLTVRAMDSRLRRTAIGAVLDVWIGDRRLRREVRVAYSYLCSNDPRVHFGLGSAIRVDRLAIRWPDGTTDSISDVPANQRISVAKGSGQWRPE